MKKLLSLLIALCIAAGANAIVLDKKGLGSWRIGQRASSFPNSYTGLFNNFSKDYEECMGTNFYACRNGSKATLNVYLDGSRFNGFMVYAPQKVSVKVNGKVIPGNSTAQTIFKQRGAQAYYVYWDGIGIYVDGVTFYFSQSALTASGKRKVNRNSSNGDGIQLSSADFQPSARPVSIACGEIPSC